jgi:hypothetical protein
MIPTATDDPLVQDAAAWRPVSLGFRHDWRFNSGEALWRANFIWHAREGGRPVVTAFAGVIEGSEYLIARSSRAMTKEEGGERRGRENEALALKKRETR